MPEPCNAMMFPRWSEDPRAGAPGGKTAELPLVEQPCPSCTSVVDGLEGAAFHLAERINLVVIAKTSPDRLGTYAQERGWRNLRLLSSRNNTFNRDYHAEAPDGGQLPVLNVFSRDETSELVRQIFFEIYSQFYSQFWGAYSGGSLGVV